MLIYVGIDDTDTLDDPGTNQLARHLVRELAAQYDGELILRHQLLEDPRVPCTKKNGCASILFESKSADSDDISTFVERLRALIVPWCPAGSDPGLCVASSITSAIRDWGLRCKRELLRQDEARQIAAENSVILEGLGGTNDGIIGALAAVGLMATKNDGRVIYRGTSGQDWYDVTGRLEVEDILSRGVDEVLRADTGQPLVSGTINIGKRLRPNYRGGRVVLFVDRGEASRWEAVRVV
jgi:tRNA(Ile2) C34 agmatinyltransferase TiaS